MLWCYFTIIAVPSETLRPADSGHEHESRRLNPSTIEAEPSFVGSSEVSLAAALARATKWIRLDLEQGCSRVKYMVKLRTSDGEAVVTGALPRQFGFCSHILGRDTEGHRNNCAQQVSSYLLPRLAGSV